MAEWFSRPVVFVRDTRKAVAFYVDHLGFKVDGSHEHEGELLVANVERAGCSLLLTQQWPDRVGRSVNFVSLDPGPYAAARAEFAANGVATKEGWWGFDLIIVEDPDGNALWFPYPSPPA